MDRRPSTLHHFPSSSPSPLSAGVPQFHIRHEQACIFCRRPTDLQKMACIYPNGEVAHVDCQYGTAQRQSVE